MATEGLIQWFQGIYKNDKDLAILIIGLIGGFIFTTLLPAILSHFSKIITLIGKKFGGRLAYRSIRESYLNWLFYKTQDLNLTGIIGSGEKPKLEQIFISLRVIKEGEKLSKKTEIKKEIKTSFWKKLYTQYYKTTSFLVLYLLNIFILNQCGYENASKDNLIFKSKPFWKISHIIYREGVPSILILYLFFSIFWIFPYYSLFSISYIDTILAFTGSFVWSILIIFGLLGTYEVLKDPKKELNNFEDILFFCLAVVCWIIPIILINITIQDKVIQGLQSPLAIELGMLLGTTSIVSIWALDKKKHKFNEPFAKEIGEILSTNNYIAILGKPGSGKSTLSQFLALTYAKEEAGDHKIKSKGICRDCFGTNEWYLPIFIPLREISKFLVDAENKKYENLIIEAFRQKILPSNIRNILKDSYIYDMLKNKKCLFLLDGLDEVQNPIEFKAVLKEINGLISRYPENKVIVTSRRSGWRGGIGSMFNVFEIEDLNDEEIERFIDSWYAAIEENKARISEKTESKEQLIFRKGEASEKANKLKQALSKTKSIRRIAENPLLLSIICFVHYNKTLPKERLRLYQDCSNLLLVQWDEEKGLAVDDTNLTFACKEEIIQEIAFSFHTGKIGENFGRKEANGDEIIPIVEKKLTEFEMDPTQAESLFKKLIERSGIIIVTDKYANRYSFSHLTFQEFYSAMYLHQNKLDIFKVISQVSDNLTDALNGWWREVILLYCLLIKDPTEIIERLYRGSDNDILQQNLQIAVQCLDESVKITNQEVRENILEKVLWIRTHGTSKSNINSLDPRIKSYLIKFAQSPFFYIHVITYKIIQVKSEDVSFLISKILQLSQSTDRDLRLIAVEALDILALKFDRSQEINSSVINQLLNDTDPNIQRATAKLILNNFPRPLEDAISIKLFEIFENSLNYFIRELRFIDFRDVHIDFIDDKQFSPEKKCYFLEQIIEASSEGILIEIHERIGKIVSKFFNTNLRHEKEKFICILKNFMQLNDEKLRETHRFQLMEALLKGNKNQQINSIFALSELYSSDPSIVGLVLDKLKAPHSDVRTAVILSLSKLDIKDDEFKNVLAYLNKHRTHFSKFRFIQNYIIQILTGKGEIGLQEKELEDLELYFKSIDKKLNISTRKIPRIGKIEEKIDEFLRKKELSGIIKEKSKDKVLENLGVPEIYLNEAAFNFLLEERMI